MPDSPFTSIVGLGALKSQHHLAKGPHTILIVLGVVYAIGWCGVLAMAYVMFSDSYQQQGLLQALMLPLFCILVWLAPGLALVRQLWWSGIQSVALYEQGFAVRTRQGVTVVPWQDVEQFWVAYGRAGSRSITRAYVLRTKDGQTFRLRSNLENFNQLRDEVVPRASMAMIQHLWKKIQDGERVPFGDLSLDRIGLYDGKNVLHWNDIEALRIQNNAIWVKRTGQWTSWASLGLSLPPIFEALASNFVPIEQV